ncbi:MAG: hypothetical protein J1F02_04010 [Lachnospiraceae bacterium]|nr:hypothetical protein [Lachnospiraceae bacterium]
MRTLYVAFKGKGNSSNRIVSNLVGDKLFLTNSFAGLKHDIDSINETYDLVYMFGLDKNLKGDIRVDSIADKDGVRLCSDMDLNAIITRLDSNGLTAKIGSAPTKYLCNEAYWYMLKKYNNHVVFFHVPSIKYIGEEYIEKIKNALIF